MTYLVVLKQQGQLVVGLPFDKVVGPEVPEQVPPALVVQEDEDAKGESPSQPFEPDRVQVQHRVHAGRVAEKDGHQGLKDQSEVQRPVGHLLGHDRHPENIKSWSLDNRLIFSMQCA